MSRQVNHFQSSLLLIRQADDWPSNFERLLGIKVRTSPEAMFAILIVHMFYDPIGQFMVAIEKTAEEKRTDLTITNFPPCIRNAKVDVTHFPILWISGINFSIFGFVVPSGKPI